MPKAGVRPSSQARLNNKSTLLLGLILVIATFTRLYRLPATLQFLGDQGRDAIIVSRIWRHFDLPFIGPVTSIGNVYLGPLYYYYMAPWLWLSYPSPIGPAYGVAVLSILTVYLTYRWGKALVGPPAALIAALMLAVNQQAIFFSRFSWNPNPAPLAALAFVYSIFRSRRSQGWWLLTAVALAVLLQLHYITLLCLPVGLIFWLIQLKQVWFNPVQRRRLLIWTVVAGVIFFSLMSPLVLFDFKHHGQNLMAFWQMTGSSQALSHAAGRTFFDKLVISVFETHARSIYLLTSAWWPLPTAVATGVVLAWVTLVIALIYQPKTRQFGHIVLAVTFLISLLGLSFYGHEVYDHYVLFLLPITTLLWAAVLTYLARQHFFLKVLSVIFVSSAIVYNVWHWPVLQTASPSLAILQKTAQTIVDQVQPGEKYNLVLLSETKDFYGSNYRYFLTTYRDKQPLIPERDDLNSADTLFVVDEVRLTTDLNSIQQAEIRAFPNKTSDSLIEIPDGPRLFVLHRQYQGIDLNAYNGKQSE